MTKVYAKWTGDGPHLCIGEWKLFVQDRDFSDLLADIKEMNTAGTYWRCGFGDDWSEVWEQYEDGLEYPDWVKENVGWLSQIAADPVVAEETGSNTEELYRAIYEAISAEDWRHNSCGGCI